MVEALQPQATEQNIGRVTKPAPDLPPLDIDPQRIEQVLRNLLSNALRYTPAGGRVQITTARVGNSARVEVSDTGAGIPADALPHVFERFWRGDQTCERAQGSASLGLATAKQWIEAHGGQIGVESQVGQGTTFWFTLPLL